MKLSVGALKQVSAFLEGLEKLSRDTGVWAFTYERDQLETSDGSVVNASLHKDPETGYRGYHIESDE